MEDVGAIAAFGRTFVGGTRNDAAEEGGGLMSPLPGRGGAGALPNVGGFRRGGLEDLMTTGVSCGAGGFDI